MQVDEDGSVYNLHKVTRGTNCACAVVVGGDLRRNLKLILRTC